MRTTPSVKPNSINTIATGLDSLKGANDLILSVKLGKVAIEEPLINGSKIFPRMAEAIKNAQSEVLIMGYRLDAGSDVEKDLVAALTELNKKAAGLQKKIQVRVLINERVGAAAWLKPSSNQNTTNALKDLDLRQFEYLDFQYAEHRHSGFGAYHCKMVVVDNHTALMGSCDLLQNGNYQDGSVGWVDMTTVFQGELVKSIRQDFKLAWESGNNVTIDGTPHKVIPKDLSSSLEEKTESAAIAFSEVPALFISKKAKGLGRSDLVLSPFTLAIIQAINNSNCSIHIMSPNLNIPEVINALADANKRGVPIYIIMGKHMNDESESKPGMGGTNEENMNHLLDLVKESPYRNKLRIRWATNDEGKQVIPYPHQNTMHAGVSCIDDLVFTGSSVLDKQSGYHSREADVIMQSDDVCKMYLDQVFWPHFNKGADARISSTAEHQKAYHSERHRLVRMLVRKQKTLKKHDLAREEKLGYVEEIKRRNKQAKTGSLNRLEKYNSYLDLKLRAIVHIETLVGIEKGNEALQKKIREDREEQLSHMPVPDAAEKQKTFEGFVSALLLEIRGRTGQDDENESKQEGAVAPEANKSEMRKHAGSRDSFFPYSPPVPGSDALPPADVALKSAEAGVKPHFKKLGSGSDTH